MFVFVFGLNFIPSFQVFKVQKILYLFSLKDSKFSTLISGETFVTRKITRAVAKIALGQQDSIELGNLNSRRDWGHAREYVEVKYFASFHDFNWFNKYFLG